MEELELSYPARRNAKWYNHFGNSLTVSYNIEHILLFDLAIVFLATYLRDMKTYVSTKAFMQIFMAAIFIIASNWK